MKYAWILLSFCFLPALYGADNRITVDAPLKIPLLLSGNFGELRGNHFHTGLDFKTQGRTGLPVYAADDGYVSRINVSPYGYGQALYIDHPSGITTVYAHLDRYAPFIGQVVREKQYEQESYSVDFTPDDRIEVKRGQLIAYSGNTGSSGGPHLHFEIRDTPSEKPLNPAPYFLTNLTDTRLPAVRNVALYPVPGRGVVNGSSSRLVYTPTAAPDGKYTVTGSCTGWGDLYLGVKAYDYMDHTTNTYGIYSMKIFVDDSLLCSFKMDTLSFDESRAINTFIDYGDWNQNRSFYMRSYVAPGNRLPIYTGVANQGIFTIRQEKVYRVRYELSDIYGNTARIDMKVTGKKQPIPEHVCSENEYPLSCDRKNVVKGKGLYWEVPKGAFYDDVDLLYRYKERPGYYSAVHTLGDGTIPLHLNTTLTIDVLNDTLPDKTKYYVARLGQKADVSCGGVYESGRMTATIRDLGSFAVKADRMPPVITPLGQEKWGSTGNIRFRIGDAGSGVASFRGEIDGKFALFALDGKTSVVQCTLDSSRIEKGKKHRLQFEVIDGCGNKKQFTSEFYW
ncbi:MAG: M23 family metallopeptidase [Coprobacter sp.]|nr:M23 family metallopeptidase [Coprobacter sp.]